MIYRNEVYENIDNLSMDDIFITESVIEIVKEKPAIYF